MEIEMKKVISATTGKSTPTKSTKKPATVKPLTALALAKPPVISDDQEDTPSTPLTITEAPAVDVPDPKDSLVTCTACGQKFALRNMTITAGRYFCLSVNECRGRRGLEPLNITGKVPEKASTLKEKA